MSQVIQGSPEWHALRAGIPTGSGYATVLARGRGDKESTTRQNYIIKCAIERITGKAIDGAFSGNRHTERGHEREPFARMALEEYRGYVVEEVDFIRHPTIATGVSPDGVVIGQPGLAEFKSPTPHVHWEYLKLDSVPTEYRAQVQGQMMVTGRQWVDSASYNPDFPDHLQLKVIRVLPDLEFHERLKRELVIFNAEVDDVVAEMEEMAVKAYRSGVEAPKPSELARKAAKEIFAPAPTFSSSLDKLFL